MFKLNIKTKQKAFTLIELLIVVAIIGILAGVILISTTSAREKARDASIMQSAKSFMRAAQVDSTSSGDYTSWYATNEEVGNTYYVGSAWDCNHNFAQSPTAQAACNKMLSDIGSTVGGSAGKLWIGPSNWNPGLKKLRLVVVLPYVKKYFCLGSNDKSSAITDFATSDGNPTCGGAYQCPGCIAEDVAN